MKAVELTHPETGVTKKLVEWARFDLGVEPRTLRKRIEKGQDWWKSPIVYVHDRPLEHPITKEVRSVKEWAGYFGIPLGTLKASLRRDRLGTSRKKWFELYGKGEKPIPRAKKAVKISKATKLLGVSVKTVRRRSNSGKLAHWLTPSGHRRFELKDLEAIGEAN